MTPLDAKARYEALMQRYKEDGILTARHVSEVSGYEQRRAKEVVKKLEAQGYNLPRMYTAGAIKAQNQAEKLWDHYNAKGRLTRKDITQILGIRDPSIENLKAKFKRHNIAYPPIVRRVRRVPKAICQNCQKLKPLKHGRCTPCAKWFDTHYQERPPYLWDTSLKCADCNGDLPDLKVRRGPICKKCKRIPRCDCGKIAAHTVGITHGTGGTSETFVKATLELCNECYELEKMLQEAY